MAWLPYWLSCHTESYGEGTAMGKFGLPMSQVLAKLETTWQPNHTIKANYESLNVNLRLVPLTEVSMSNSDA
jgi:hypothetical protein